MWHENLPANTAGAHILGKKKKRIKNSWKYKVYSQSTLTRKVWLTGSPIPLSAIQRYCPVKFLAMFTICQGLPTNSTFASPSPNILVQVIFGAGLPVALQYTSRLEPSVTVCVPGAEVILDGSERKQYDNMWLWSSFIITLILTNCFITASISKGSMCQNVSMWHENLPANTAGAHILGKKKKRIKNSWKYKVYSQSTLTRKVWLTGSPIPLSAIQRYCPVKFLAMFTICQGLPTNSTSVLPSPNTVVQVIFGAGLPVALQYKSRLEPSVTVCLSRDEVILDGA